MKYKPQKYIRQQINRLSKEMFISRIKLHRRAYLLVKKYITDVDLHTYGCYLHSFLMMASYEDIKKYEQIRKLYSLDSNSMKGLYRFYLISRLRINGWFKLEVEKNI